MSKNKRITVRSGGGRERRITVRGVRRDHPDLRKLSRALLDFAVAQAEADAQADNAVPKVECADD